MGKMREPVRMVDIDVAGEVGGEVAVLEEVVKLNCFLVLSFATNCTGSSYCRNRLECLRSDRSCVG